MRQRMIWLLISLWISSHSALAQVTSGTISGTVKDTTGAVAPGAKITVLNEDTGISRAVETDSACHYVAPSLALGNYRVTVSLEGFQTAVRSGILLTVGREAVVDFSLSVGAVTQELEVKAEAPLVETTTNAVSGLVAEQAIQELPLNGRSFDQLISLQSSAPVARIGGHVAGVGEAAFFTVGGARFLSNDFILDGTEVLGGGNQTTLPGGALGINMGVDAVREFQILTSSYSAAFGKRAGGVINIATRSGTNQLHGSAYEFIRNSDLDARNFFDTTLSPPPFKRNQFGGSLGGPIRKDKAFFFVNYEGLRQALTETNISIVPDNNVRQGLLPVNGTLVNVGVAPNVAPFIPYIFGPVNGKVFGDGTAQSILHPLDVGSQNYVLGRFDAQLTDKDSVFVRYNITLASINNPSTSSLFLAPLDTRDQVLTIGEQKVFSPTTLNLFRFGFTRGRSFDTSVSINPLPANLTSVPGYTPIAQIDFGATSNSGGFITSAGLNTAVNTIYLVNQFDVSDQVTKTAGQHTLQFGAQVQKIQHNDTSNKAPIFDFTSLANFLAGTPSLFISQPPQANAEKGIRQTYFAGFVQDEYHVTHNLTLNLGLRYELMTVPTEANNRVSNYRPTILNGLIGVETNPTLGSPFFNGHHGEFAPRVGFAWSPGDGKTVVRGGGGIFYDQLLSEFRFYTSSNAPFVSQVQITNPPFPLGFSGAGGTSTPSPQGIDPNVDVPTRVEYNFGVQRQLNSSIVLEAQYVGSHSYHLSRVHEANPTRPTFLPGGIVSYPTASGSPRINPALGGTQFVSTDAISYYNSLQVDLKQRLSRGLRYQISYTYAKLMDDASTITSQEALGSPSFTQNPFNLLGDLGLSSYDLKNSFAANFTYDLPGSGLKGALGRTLGGWEVGSIITVTSGFPFTAVTGFNRSNDAARNIADRPSLLPNASNNPNVGRVTKWYNPSVFTLPPAGQYGNLGRNTLIGPGLTNVDFNLAKTFAVIERLHATFRFDVFNLLNHASFALPSNTIFSSNGQILGAAGTITSTVGTSRQLQFALKLIF